MTDPSAPQPVIDAARYAELGSDFGPEGAQEIVRAFVDETDRQVAAILAASGGPDQIAADAHGVKGGAMLVGAALLQEAALELEQRARNGADLEQAIGAISAAWALTRAELHR